MVSSSSFVAGTINLSSSSVAFAIPIFFLASVDFVTLISFPSAVTPRFTDDVFTVLGSFFSQALFRVYLTLLQYHYHVFLYQHFHQEDYQFYC